ncbi:MAG: hypothetical protein R2758_03405 [Bacteroidales bacterium]
MKEERIGGEFNYDRNDPNTWDSGYGINMVLKGLKPSPSWVVFSTFRQHVGGMDTERHLP